MNRIIVFPLLCIFLAGCSAQKVEQKYNSPEPSEITQENSAEESSEPEEGFNFDAEFSEHQEEQREIQDEIASIANDTNLPMWSDMLDDIPYDSYTIEYQRELPGQSYIGYTDYFDIVEKNNKIYVKTDEWDACCGVIFLEITEEQLQSILTADNSNSFIYSFTVTNVCNYDMEIFAEGEDGDNYMSVDGVSMYLIIYATCKEIYKFI